MAKANVRHAESVVPENESTPRNQRIVVVPEKLDEGPKVGPSGNYEPAAYKSGGVTRIDR